MEEVKNLQIKKIDNHPLHISVLYSMLLLIFGICVGIISGVFVFDGGGIITYASLILFIFVTIYASLNDNNLSLIIPFVFLAFPTNCNDVFPGVYLDSERLNVVYPLICHTELFLLLVLLFSKKKVKNWGAPALVYLLVVSFLITSTCCVLRNYNDSQYVILLIAGQYPIRILILVTLLIRNHTFYIDRFILGTCFSIFFLTLESAVYSKVSGAEGLESGSLGINTFGNVMGQMSCLLLFSLISLKKNIRHRVIVYGAILFGLVVTFLTETRMALLAIAIVFLVILMPKMNKKIKFLLAILIVGATIYVIKSDLISNLTGKMDIRTAMSAIDISRSAGIEIERTESTTSLVTRLELWTAATQMFLDHPLTGIGWNLFNVLKYKYGFEEKVIIDPHNGYFSFLCNLGIWAIFWVYFIFYRSWKIFIRSKNNELKTLAVFNMGMSVCELTNAGSYKYSVLSMLLFISVYINYYYTIESQIERQKAKS